MDYVNQTLYSLVDMQVLISFMTNEEDYVLISTVFYAGTKPLTIVTTINNYSLGLQITIRPTRTQLIERAVNIPTEVSFNDIYLPMVS